jgi:shikimate kinase
MKSWILIGMMGAGKTTTGHLLAEAANRSFVDTDKLIEFRLGRPIPKIFEHYGEQAFRDHETSIIKTLSSAQEVVSTGGGAVLRAENWNHFRKIGTTIYLRASADEIIKRLATSKRKRPLLDTENWEERVHQILGERAELYMQADVVVDVDRLDQEELVQRILKEVQ